MKHFKLWCIVLAVFVGLTAVIVLIQREQSNSRKIASIEVTEQIQKDIQQLADHASEISNEEASVKADLIMKQIESTSKDAVSSVETIYQRGQEILEEIKTIETSTGLNGLKNEINDLKKQLDQSTEDLKNLLSIVDDASKKNSSLEQPLKGINERLELVRKEINQANEKATILQENKAVALADIDEKLLVVQASEIEELKRKNCDMEETVCRQKDELTRLQEQVEELIKDKQDVADAADEKPPVANNQVVTSYSDTTSIGMFSLMLQMQLTMMNSMMNSFSLYFPVQTSSSLPTFNYSPKYDFNLFGSSNFFGSASLMGMGQGNMGMNQGMMTQNNSDKRERTSNSDDDSNITKSNQKVDNADNRQGRDIATNDASGLSDEEIRAINDAEFAAKNEDYTPGRFATESQGQKFWE